MATKRADNLCLLEDEHTLKHLFTFIIIVNYV